MEGGRGGCPLAGPGPLSQLRPQELRAPQVTTSEGDPVAKGVAKEGPQGGALFREEGNG